MYENSAESKSTQTRLSRRRHHHLRLVPTMFGVHYMNYVSYCFSVNILNKFHPKIIGSVSYLKYFLSLDL